MLTKLEVHNSVPAEKQKYEMNIAENAYEDEESS